MLTVICMNIDLANMIPLTASPPVCEISGIKADSGILSIKFLTWDFKIETVYKQKQLKLVI